MSEVKFTPGPWEVGSFWYPEGGISAPPGYCEISQVGEMGILARVYDPQKGYLSHGEGRANAALIAAAPDFFEASKRILEDHDSKAIACNFTACGCDWCDVIRPIVAKSQPHPTKEFPQKVK